MLLNIGDIEIGYDLSGDASAPLVILGHAFCSSRDLWLEQEPALLAAGFQVLRFDVRGHGESVAPGASISFPRLVADVIALLDGLAIERAHYAGISMSGMVGQYLALAHPDRLRTLTLMNTTSRYDDAQRQGWTERAEVAERDGVAVFHDALMARWFTPESLDRNPPGVALMSRLSQAMPADIFAAAMRMIGQVDTADRLAEINLPTLVLAGARDPATPPEMGRALHQGISGSEIVMIEDAAHISPVEQPAAVNAALLDFLARHEGAPT